MNRIITLLMIFGAFILVVTAVITIGNQTGQEQRIIEPTETSVWEGDGTEGTVSRGTVTAAISAGITDINDITEVLKAAAQVATACDIHLKDATELVANYSVTLNDTPHEVANGLIADKELCEGVALKK